MFWSLSRSGREESSSTCRTSLLYFRVQLILILFCCVCVLVFFFSSSPLFSLIYYASWGQSCCFNLWMYIFPSAKSVISTLSLFLLHNVFFALWTISILKEVLLWVLSAIVKMQFVINIKLKKNISVHNAETKTKVFPYSFNFVSWYRFYYEVCITLLLWNLWYCLSMWWYYIYSVWNACCTNHCGCCWHIHRNLLKRHYC